MTRTLPIGSTLAARLVALGFDRSRSVRGSKSTRAMLGCSQCDARAVNGVPLHESGCPRETFECKGCNARVARRGAYCAECAS